MTRSKPIGGALPPSPVKHLPHQGTVKMLDRFPPGLRQTGRKANAFPLLFYFY